jgi:type I restriction enzyme, R subunit
VHHEATFGDAIVDFDVGRRVAAGRQRRLPADLALDTAQLFEFIGETQIDEWSELLTYYGGDTIAAQQRSAKRLDQAISNDGLLEVLRRGVKDRGVRIRVAYFQPSLVASDDMLDNYRANRLTVVKELEYATKHADRATGST